MNILENLNESVAKKENCKEKFLALLALRDELNKFDNAVLENPEKDRKFCFDKTFAGSDPARCDFMRVSGRYSKTSNPKVSFDWELLDFYGRPCAGISLINTLEHTLRQTVDSDILHLFLHVLPVEEEWIGPIKS